MKAYKPAEAGAVQAKFAAARQELSAALIERDQEIECAV
jgi:hypothetical protein